MSAISHLANVACTQRPVQLVDLESAQLRISNVPIRNDERELEWSYVLMHHLSPSLLVDQWFIGCAVSEN